ncbi:alpha/beta hydrolase family esterase [Micromonospora sp. NPDC048868]|uniref:alpha/beta hydrolase family esterase n=1 Tax=Micromonospora sp. NPDC048868 TaxID=3364258 RepID=UPI00371FE377
MRRTVAVLTGLLFAVVATACGGDRGQSRVTPAPSPSGAVERPAAGDHRLTLAHGGADRRYLLHAPPGYDPARPTALVIALHFYPGSGARLRDMVGLDAVADRENFLVAYPDGQNGGFNALICCGTTDDVGFLKDLTAHLVRTWRADPDRVYLLRRPPAPELSQRRSSIRVLPRVFGLTRSRSRNSATPSSYERSSCS